MVYMYMHAGSNNHGCEAIVRSTLSLTKERCVLFSEHPQEDINMGLDKICRVVTQGHSRNKKSLGFIAVKGLEYVVGSVPKYLYLYKNIFSIKEKSLFLSIGGDNYCYDNNKNLAYINRKLHKQGHITGLWGCSIEPSVVVKDGVRDDLLLYDFITARESITFNSLKKIGHRNVYLIPDPAFLLKSQPVEFDKEFFKHNVIGINLSPVVKSVDKTGMLLDNYITLIDWIIENTNYNIALIPHVCKMGNDDRLLMKEILSRKNYEGRVLLFNENGKMNCEELKYIIGKCNVMIAARTHASIAAYSQKIPTIVVGYSVKAEGIAKDIFDTKENYVIDSRSLNTNSDLLDRFIELLENENAVRNYLESVMDDYIYKAGMASDIIANYNNR